MPNQQDPRPDPAGQSQTILVVDDERMVRELVCRILRLRGYTVLEADRGAEALRIVQEHAGPIHLLLTDVLMPEMNGPTLAEQVTALNPRTRVLYMSGCPDGCLPPRLSLKAGIAFIRKPFATDALAHKVREVLGAAG